MAAACQRTTHFQGCDTRKCSDEAQPTSNAQTPCSRQFARGASAEHAAVAATQASTSASSAWAKIQHVLQGCAWLASVQTSSGVSWQTRGFFVRRRVTSSKQCVYDRLRAQLSAPRRNVLPFGSASPDAKLCPLHKSQRVPAELCAHCPSPVRTTPLVPETNLFCSSSPPCPRRPTQPSQECLCR